MRQWACLYLPDLPLQWAQRTHPEWQQDPVAVVAEDKPTAKVLWANRKARVVGVAPGMLFGSARTLAARLHGIVVPQDLLLKAVDGLWRDFTRFTPGVEPHSEQLGLFWLDPNGLLPVFGSLEVWAQQILAHVQHKGWQQACLVLGYSRFATFALAQEKTSWQDNLKPMAPVSVGESVALGEAFELRIMPDVATEKQAMRKVPLQSLAVAPKWLHEMELLGLHTLGDLLAAPQAAWQLRYGRQVGWLRRMIEADLRQPMQLPLQAKVIADPIELDFEFEHGEQASQRLLFAIKSKFPALLKKLKKRHQAMACMKVRLTCRDVRAPMVFAIQPAAPTMEARQILDLVRLRLQTLPLPGAVTQVHLRVQGAVVEGAQPDLDGVRTGTALAQEATQASTGMGVSRQQLLPAAHRAMARVQALLGAGTVTQAHLQPGVLPETQFAWRPVREVKLPQLDFTAALPDGNPLNIVVRRLLHPAQPWRGSCEHIQRLLGPFRVSGGWWSGTFERDYYYLETKQGYVLWVYYQLSEHKVGRWMIQGVID